MLEFELCWDVFLWLPQFADDLDLLSSSLAACLDP